MYLVGLYIYITKMIHGPYNVKLTTDKFHVIEPTIGTRIPVWRIYAISPFMFILYFTISETVLFKPQKQALL